MSTGYQNLNGTVSSSAYGNWSASSGFPSASRIPTATFSSSFISAASLRKSNMISMSSLSTWICTVLLCLQLLGSASAFNGDPAENKFISSLTDTVRQVDYPSSVNAKDISVTTTPDLEIRGFYPDGTFAEILVKIASKFGQGSSKKLFKSLTSSDKPQNCPAASALSSQSPWYQQLTYQTVDDICGYLGDATSLSKNVENWFKDKFLLVSLVKDLEALCVARARTYIASLDAEILLVYGLEPPLLATSVVVYLLADVVCKVTISSISHVSIGATLGGICKSIHHVAWPEPVGLPCTPGIIPATPPFEVTQLPSVSPSASLSVPVSTSVPTPPTSSGVGNFSFDSLGVNLPCATVAMAIFISAGAAGNPLPYNRRLSYVLCNGLENHGDDTTRLCEQVCADPCVTYPESVVRLFMEKYNTPEWYNEHWRNNGRCDAGTKWLLGACPDLTTEAWRSHCEED
jgi:hypothetical protein